MGKFIGNQTAILEIDLKNSTQILIVLYINLSNNNNINNLHAKATDRILIGNFCFSVIPSANQINKRSSYLRIKFSY